MCLCFIFRDHVKKESTEVWDNTKIVYKKGKTEFTSFLQITVFFKEYNK